MTLAAIGPGFVLPVIGRGIGAILLYAVVGVLLMLLGFYAIDITTPGKLNRMVRDGPAQLGARHRGGHDQHGVHRRGGHLQLDAAPWPRACSAR